MNSRYDRLDLVTHSNLRTVVQKQIGKPFRHTRIIFADKLNQVEMFGREVDDLIHESVRSHAFLL